MIMGLQQAAEADYSQVLADTHKTGSAGFEVVLPTVTPMAWGTYVAFYKVRPTNAQSEQAAPACLCSIADIVDGYA